MELVYVYTGYFFLSLDTCHLQLRNRVYHHKFATFGRLN